MMKKIAFLLVFLGLLLQPLFSAGLSQAQEDLELWIHPFLPANQIIKRFTPIADYLGEKIGQPVTVKVSTSYQSHIERVGEDRIDLAYMGPAPYVKMTGSYGPKPLLAMVEVDGAPYFHGMIITRQDSSLQDLADLAGKSFAFGDKNSTMSHLVPRYMLQQSGVDAARLKSHAFLKGHRNVALAVLGGYYDAGALKESIFHLYEERGLRVLAKSPPIPSHLFVTRNSFSPDKILALRQALLELQQDERSGAIFQTIKGSVTGMLPVTDQHYDLLRDILRATETSGE